MISLHIHLNIILAFKNFRDTLAMENENSIMVLPEKLEFGLSMASI